MCLPSPRTAIFPRLWVLDDPSPRDGPCNMALDEALLRNLAKLDTEPNARLPLAILRVYHWERPSISFGYFGSADRVRANHPGQPLVRRWTGGGVVNHGESVDWTYSLIVPRELPLYTLPAMECYAAIHDALARALEQAGLLGTSLADAQRDPGSAHPHDIASGACFTRPVRADVFRHGRKIAGAAQRRTRAGLLHQGSVQDADLRLDAVGRAALISTLVSELTFEQTAIRWWRSPLDSIPIFQEVLAAATTLTQMKYSTAAWLEKR